MKIPIQILLLEDSEFDAKLVAHELKKLGRPFRMTRIQSEPELRHELEVHLPDIILSDHGLPSFDGINALEIVRQTRPDLPFIFVSGSNDQQMVVDMYDRGATDYVFKHDLQDLVPAVRHALEQPPETSLPYPELELELPAASAIQPVSSPPLGHLRYCPKCHQSRDEAGKLVQMEEFLDRHAEVDVLRQPCAECSQSARR